MALQTSGAISLNDIHVEVGGTSGTLCSLNDADFRSLISVGNNANQSLQLYYGKSNEIQMTSGGTVNGIAQRKQISASSFISSGGTLRIPSSMWVWSDSRTVAALTVDIPCTIINDGKIIGKGGQEVEKLKLEIKKVIKKLKSDNSPVTNADLKANTIICEGLRKYFPKVPW